MASGIFFILGAGASFDSGLPTYRGPEGIYANTLDPENVLSCYSPLEKVWEFLAPLYQKIGQSYPGPTYELIKELGEKYPGSFILTQNIDGHASSTGLPVIEMHGSWKTMTCHRCELTFTANPYDPGCKCGAFCRPDIVLYDEDLPQKKIQQVYDFINNRPKMVVVIGTTLQFPYLRKFITKSKERGAEIIHINPDDNYESNVRRRETWYDTTSQEGLKKLLEF